MEVIEDAVGVEEIPDSFSCCICWELLYKPVVLSCGHMSCFWCVHNSMNSARQSNCPICRNPYNHFPTICWMLHLLLLKMFPVAYKAREEQMLEEEKKQGCFSPQPQLDSNARGSHNFQECDPPKDLSSPSATCLISGEISDSMETFNAEGMNMPQDKPCGKDNLISMADALCVSCKQLLHRPVVLNCGHVYCQTCIVNPVEKMLRCQACQTLHPKVLPKVCLEFDKFLAEQFPRDYASRRDAVMLKEECFKGDKREGSTSSKTGNDLPWLAPRTSVHVGVGCDFCGILPIIGERYSCQDCPEKIGFDLCRDCYYAGYNLPGRFNQQHTPDHKLELVNNQSRFQFFERMHNEMHGRR